MPTSRLIFCRTARSATSVVGCIAPSIAAFSAHTEIDATVCKKCGLLHNRLQNPSRDLFEYDRGHRLFNFGVLPDGTGLGGLEEMVQAG